MCFFYYFSDTKEIFDKIFVEKGEILKKNYGSIETKSKYFLKKKVFYQDLNKQLIPSGLDINILIFQMIIKMLFLMT